MQDTPVERSVSRVLLLDENDRVFLLRHVNEASETPNRWLPPGGGLEVGESFEAAALRELRDETGVGGITLGPCILHQFAYRYKGRVYEATEHYFLCRTEGMKIGALNQTPSERTMVVDYRWWDADEIQASSEVFVPRALGALLHSPALDGPPSVPTIVRD
jgi:8-oxo-dGTP pyrophosphatase MutT (NUDIX family)